MNAEQIIIEKIKSAFPDNEQLTDKWIESNPYLFEELSAKQSLSYISSFMIYALKMLRVVPYSMVYTQLIYTINEYSKCKNSENTHLGFWYLLTHNQKEAILSFLNHLLHNQPSSIDEKEVHKIIKRWQ